MYQVLCQVVRFGRGYRLHQEVGEKSLVQSFSFRQAMLYAYSDDSATQIQRKVSPDSEGFRLGIPIESVPLFRTNRSVATRGASTIVCICNRVRGEKSSGCSFSHGFSLECNL